MYYLSDICALCLSPIPNLQSILSKDADGVAVADKLRVLLLELVNFKPNVLKYICNNCLETLNYVYKFRLRCLNNIPALNKYVQKLETQTYGNKPHPILENNCARENQTQICDIAMNTVYIKEEIDESQYESEEIEETQNNYQNQIKTEGSNQNLVENISTQESANAFNNIHAQYEDFNEEEHMDESMTSNGSSSEDVQVLEEVPQQKDTTPTKDSPLPTKSKELYEEAYNAYKRWCAKMKISSTTEDTIMEYFNNHLANYKSSSLWTKYSMLRSTINLKENVDISKYSSIISLLKRKADGYKPKKSLTLTKENVDKFLIEADDEHYLLHKVILIFGISGACTRQELASLLSSNVQDYKTHFLVKLVDSKTKTGRSFIILPGQLNNLLELIRRYIALRSPKTTHDRFFVNFMKDKCTVQPVGVHKIASIPAVVAKFNNLENHALYTGHCFRRTSATLLANAGVSQWAV